MDMIRQEPPAPLDMPIGEAMFTHRAIRRFDHERPVGTEEIKLILDAAAKAPSGGNSQVARYLVVKDRQKIQQFGALYHEAWWAKRADAYGWTPDQEIPADSPYKMPALLAREMVDAPAVVLVFAVENVAGALSVAPGVQNLMLAARALGIGSVLTTLHPRVMDRVYELFSVPEKVRFYCCVPLGYPRGNFGVTSRLPTSQTTYWDTWDTTPPWD